MKIQLTPTAYRDLTRILTYLEERSPAGAHVVLLSIDNSFDILTLQPNASQLTNHPPVRVKRITKYPYKIFYRITDDTVEILHIRHTARYPWGKLKE